MEPVTILREDLVLVDWGPMTLTISAWKQGAPRPVMAAQAARHALGCLRVLADFQGYLKVRADRLPEGRPLPPVVERTRLAAAAVARGLSPQAAVAGAVADEVAGFAWDLGADKVIVNNGGDIALRLSPGQTLRVGVQPPARNQPGPQPLLGRLRVQAEHGIHGVASSGWQGRSLSQGVADLVTVWAASASLADAAATALGNSVNVTAPGVERSRASRLDPGSGLGHAYVVENVGRLSPGQCRTALKAGQTQALDMYKQGLIRGCLLAIQGRFAVFDPDFAYVKAALS
ncbi:MAG: hypothetical protein PVG03_07830, partial [Desulfarculaceae bacterium]